MDNENKKILIADRTFNFSLEIIKLYKYLISKNEYILSKQILKAGTSIGANVEEAQAAQTKKDFIAKMSISSKEARETYYWFRLLKKSDYLTEFDKTEMIESEIISIINIITKIVKTSQNKLISGE